MANIMDNIIKFIADVGKALAMMYEFIKSFFELILNFISMIPSPFKEILLVATGLISAIMIYKIVRGV